MSTPQTGGIWIVRCDRCGQPMHMTVKPEQGIPYVHSEGMCHVPPPPLTRAMLMEELEPISQALKTLAGAMEKLTAAAMTNANTLGNIAGMIERTTVQLGRQVDILGRLADKVKNQ